MKLKNLLAASVLAVTISGSHAAVFVLMDDDFDNPPISGNGIAASQNMSLTPTTTGDPTSSGHGEVGVVDLEPGGRWGESRGATTQNITLPATTVPGTDTFAASFDIYIPSATTNFGPGDRFGLILRWNIVNTNNNSMFQNYDLAAAQDGWYTVSLSGTLPVNGGDGNPLTTVTPIVSFDDSAADDAVVGTTAYIDNFTLSVTGAPVPEPSAAILGLLGGLMVLRRSRG